MAGGDGRLERIGSRITRLRTCPFEGRKTAADEQLVPAGAVLVEKEDRLASGPGASAQARRLDFHESDEPVNFPFSRNELCKDASEPKRLLA